MADQASKLTAPGKPSDSARRNDPRFAHLGGPALLLDNVRSEHGRCEMPVLINAWGSYRRMEMALGCHAEGHTPGGFDAIGARIASLVKPEPPRSLGELVAKAREFLPLLRIPPRRKRGMGQCQQVVIEGDKVDLRRLPLIRCWPHDGDFAALGYPRGANDGVPGLGRGPAWDAHHRGRYITLGGIHTVHADDRDNPKPPSHNIGMYRVQLLGPRTMAMHWHIHHDGARHWRSWKRLGQPMPVAIAIGGESVMPYAATAPLPPGISELLLAGFLNRGGIPMVRGRTVPLWVPANAEIVIEGYVSHEAGAIDWAPGGGEPLGPGAVFEGPFGDHTGFYSLPDRYPLLHVTAVTTRRDPIYVTTVVGLPPQEDYFLGKATERVFLPLLRTLIHDIDDYDLPMFGAFHNCAMLQIDKSYAMQGRRVMHSVWGAGQMAWTKNLFVVDKGVDVHDTRAVLSAAGRRCHPLRDVEIVRGPLDILDHAAPRLGAGAKMGFDCTAKREGEQAHGVELDDGLRVTALTDEQRAEMLAAVRRVDGVLKAEATADVAGWLFVQSVKDRAGDGARTIAGLTRAADAGMAIPPYVVVVGPAVDPADVDQAMFHMCTHADASRDVHRWASSDGVRHSMLIDATPKVPGDERNGQPVRPWPPILTMPSEVVAKAAALLA